MVAFFIVMGDGTYLMDLELFLCLLVHFLNYKCILIYENIYYIKNDAATLHSRGILQKELWALLISPMKVVVEGSSRRIIVIFYSFSVVPSPFLDLYLAQYLHWREDKLVIIVGKSTLMGEDLTNSNILLLFNLSWSYLVK
jgi:hypothetical protein